MLEQTQTSTWQSKLKALRSWDPHGLCCCYTTLLSAQAGGQVWLAFDGTGHLGQSFKYPFFRASWC